jgi:hypothetical protein
VHRHRDSFRLLAAIAPLAVAATTLAQSASVAFVDSQGRQWRELWPSVARTWFEVAAKCPTDGVTPCSGSLGNLDMNGWVWATKDQVQEMMAELAPVAAKDGCFWGAPYAPQAWSVLGYFDSLPSFEFVNSVSGWTSTVATGPGLTNHAYAPRVSTNDKIQSDASVCPDHPEQRNQASTTVGIWMFRPPCAADLDQNGTVGPSDLATLLGSWGAFGPADLNGNGMVDAPDLSLLLAAWGGC